MTPLMRHSSLLMSMSSIILKTVQIINNSSNKEIQLDIIFLIYYYYYMSESNTIMQFQTDFLKMFTFYIWKNVPQVFILIPPYSTMFYFK